MDGRHRVVGIHIIIRHSVTCLSQYPPLSVSDAGIPPTRPPAGPTDIMAV